jgi:hypothetical protein
MGGGGLKEGFIGNGYTNVSARSKKTRGNELDYISPNPILR